MRRHLLLALAIASLALSPMAATAATKDASAPHQAKKKPQHAPQRSKKRVPKKTQPAPAARAPAAKAMPVAAPRFSTDTESPITKAGDYRFAIQHGGLARLYRVHVPARYQVTEPAPLLVALHGSGRSMDDQANDAYYGLVSKSEREGFIAVFPNASAPAGDPRTAAWNTGGVDDVGFILQVVTNVFLQMNIDRGRIYAAGISSGGAMAYRLACDRPDIFKAVSAVAATDNTGGCTPAKPVSILHFHARNDKQVRFAGADGDGADPAQAGKATSVPETRGALGQAGRLRGDTASRPRPGRCLLRSLVMVPRQVGGAVVRHRERRSLLARRQEGAGWRSPLEGDFRDRLDVVLFQPALKRRSDNTPPHGLV